MLYLETPVGVGFSYSRQSSNYVAVDDKATGIYVANFKYRYILVCFLLSVYLSPFVSCIRLERSGIQYSNSVKISAVTFVLYFTYMPEGFKLFLS